MREPWAWAGWLVVLGAWSWPLWRPDFLTLIGGLGALCVLAGVSGRRRASVVGIGAAAFLLGAAAPASLPDPPQLAAQAAIRGAVVSASQKRAVVSTGAGEVEVWFAETAPRPGQRIAAWTREARPRPSLPGEMSSPWDLERAHRVSRFAVRWEILGGDPVPHGHGAEWYQLATNGGLLWALASGDRSQVDPETAALLRRTGTAHLLAISGLHIGLIATVAHGLVWWLSRPLAGLRWPWPARAAPIFAAVIASCGYASVVGWPVSAQRATVMVVTVSIGQLLGRKARPWSLLGLAAAAVTLSDPGQVSAPGFWLSFGAVAGIIAWAWFIVRWLPPDHPRWAMWLASSLGASVGATIGTLPIIAWLFQEVSPISPLTNLVAGPLLATVTVPAALLAGHLPDPCGLFFLAIADAAAQVGIGALRLLDVPPWTPAVGPAGAILLAAILPLRRKPLAAAGLALFALGVRVMPADRLKISFLSVGQGDAALVEFPDGATWLIDGGPPSNRLLKYLRRQGIRKLDAVILSHPHLDHLGGLEPIMAALSVDAFWTPRPPREDDEAEYLSLWQTARERGVPIYTADEDREMRRGALLHPLDGWLGARSAVNEESLVVALTHGRRRFLFTGDVERGGEAILTGLLEQIGGADVVKVAHHGSTTSSTERFVQASRAEWAIISCGPDNRFRHPRPMTLHRWGQIGAKVLRTDIDGTIVMETDGEDVWTRTWTPRTGWRQRSPSSMPVSWLTARMWASQSITPGSSRLWNSPPRMMLRTTVDDSFDGIESSVWSVRR
ncbi:MAG: ComEC/Rec2 family competence protein [Myxococcota bacterium]